MLLHNQKGVPIEWEANGQNYRWDAYGACEVPDVYYEHIQAEGFPVSTTPVPPKRKAAEALQAEKVAQEKNAVAQRDKLVRERDAQLLEAQKTIEAAEERAEKARVAQQRAESKQRELEERNRVLKNENEEGAEALKVAQAELSEKDERCKELEKELALARSKPAEPQSATPAKTTGRGRQKRTGTD